VDKRKVPQNILRAHLKIEERAFEEATGKKVGPAKRRELREQVKLKLLDKVLPAAAAHSVVWHPGQGIIWFGSTAEKACEALLRQWGETFETDLVAQTPRHVGLRVLGGDAEAIERAACASFSKEAPSYQLALAR
jgi:hypothetical protein